MSRADDLASSLAINEAPNNEAPPPPTQPRFARPKLSVRIPDLEAGLFCVVEGGEEKENDRHEDGRPTSILVLLQKISLPLLPLLVFLLLPSFLGFSMHGLMAGTGLMLVIVIRTFQVYEIRSALDLIITPPNDQVSSNDFKGHVLSLFRSLSESRPTSTDFLPSGPLPSVSKQISFPTPPSSSTRPSSYTSYSSSHTGGNLESARWLASPSSLGRPSSLFDAPAGTVRQFIQSFSAGRFGRSSQRWR
ncbi:hypothetical protein BDY24DRAFT_396345 [Mrakia frigida]|uniref:uncharacterized protein n=1 Tax=Mrakia frigida TaxID=29902 RepID=UPI003FCC0108